MNNSFVLYDDVMQILSEYNWQVSSIIRKGNWYTVDLLTSRGKDFIFKTGARIDGFIWNFLVASEKWKGGDEEDEKEVKEVGFEIDDMEFRFGCYCDYDLAIIEE